MLHRVLTTGFWAGMFFLELSSSELLSMTRRQAFVVALGVLCVRGGGAGLCVIPGVMTFPSGEVGPDGGATVLLGLATRLLRSFSATALDRGCTL